MMRGFSFDELTMQTAYVLQGNTAHWLVHVVFSPNETQLVPGEIMVCPGTDPAWTPLFMTAGGLITEVGGMMTHGSVVAREYGIPAVVGVGQATLRLTTGMRIRVDGSAGTVTIIPSPRACRVQVSTRVNQSGGGGLVAPRRKATINT